MFKNIGSIDFEIFSGSSQGQFFMLNIYLSDSVKMCYAILESRQQKELFLEKIFFVTFERYKIMYVTHLMLQLCPIPLVKGSMAPKRINQGLLL